MDLQQYQRIHNFLSKQEIPTDLITPRRIKQFKNFCNNFIIKNNFIYKKDKTKQGNLLRVIRASEMEPVLYMMHTAPTGGHFSTDIMFNKIKARYYWPQLYENIRNYVQCCDTCQ